jgi:DNA-binding MarR family transcriptional regulator
LLKHLVSKGILKVADDQISQLSRDLFNIIKQIPSIRPQVEGLGEGISRTELELLAFLLINQSEEKRLFSPSEIGNLLSITPAAVTHMINPLEKAGFVERMPDEHDRRLVLIRLTRKGESIATLLIENFQERLEGFIDHIGVEESRTFIRLMNKMLTYVSSMSTTTEV